MTTTKKLSPEEAKNEERDAWYAADCPDEWVDRATFIGEGGGFARVATPDVDPSTITAVRTWNRVGTKATVTVTVPELTGDPHVRTVGGNRAARCSYAIVYQRNDGSWSLLGLRTDRTNGEGNNWHAIPIEEG